MKRELLEELRAGFERLEAFDDVELNSLRSRGRMVVGRVFGEDSSYTEELFNIRFKLKPGPVAIVSSFGGSGGGESPAMRQEREAKRQERERRWVAGQRESINLIDTMLKDLEWREAEEVQSVEDSTTLRSNRVFVVHGHDNEMKQAVARTLERLGLEAVILHEKPNRGQTIIEKIERFSDVSFAVVLLSPDDSGYSNADGVNAAKPRARQNVILELGYFAGKLGRENVVALHRGSRNEKLELPSDYDGVLYTPYDGDSGTWRSELVAELRDSGYDVDANRL